MSDARTLLREARDALRQLLRETNNIEVLGEWEAQDINFSSRKKVRARVDAVITTARTAVANADAYLAAEEAPRTTEADWRHARELSRQGQCDTDPYYISPEEERLIEDRDRRELPERLDAYADDAPTGSQMQSDLYAVATHVRKSPPYARREEAPRTAPQSQTERMNDGKDDR